MKKSELKKLIKDFLSEYYYTNVIYFDGIKEDINRKRFVVTCDFYVWGKDEKDANREAEKIRSKVDIIYDNDIRVISIEEKPFGSF